MGNLKGLIGKGKTIFEKVSSKFDVDDTTQNKNVIDDVNAVFDQVELPAVPTTLPKWTMYLGFGFLILAVLWMIKKSKKKTTYSKKRSAVQKRRSSSSYRSERRSKKRQSSFSRSKNTKRKR